MQLRFFLLFLFEIKNKVARLTNLLFLLLYKPAGGANGQQHLRVHKPGRSGGDVSSAELRLSIGQPGRPEPAAAELAGGH